MYIHRMVTKDVPGLPDQDLTFWDEWRNEPLRSVLFTGPNGSGKTTLLRVIAGLWDAFGSWLRDESANLSQMTIPESARLARLGARAVLSEAGMAAIEIRDLLPTPLWLWVLDSRKNHTYTTLLNAVVLGAHEIGERISHPYTGSDLPEIDLALNGTTMLVELRQQLERLALGAGVREQAPSNMLFLPTEDRRIKSANRPNNNEIQPEPLYRWLTTYQATTEWNTHIESMLRNLKVRDPAWFQDTLKQINTFLEASGKSIIDFDANLRLTVRITKDGATHPLSELSSGEQQFVILIFMMNRWLMPGGVLLIDEPDLYLHVSWQRAMVRELERLVHDKNGQLIITSHAEEIWDNFGPRSSFNLNPLIQVQTHG